MTNVRYRHKPICLNTHKFNIDSGFLLALSNVNGGIRTHIFASFKLWNTRLDIDTGEQFAKKKKKIPILRSIVSSAVALGSGRIVQFVRARKCAPFVYFSEGMEVWIGHGFINCEWRKIGMFFGVRWVIRLPLKGASNHKYASLVSILQIIMYDCTWI